MSTRSDEWKQLEDKTQRSREMYNESRPFTPFGIHSNYRFAEPYPHYFKRGRGSRLWDVDGNEYIDFNMAFGALTVGHAHPAIVEALWQQRKYSPPTRRKGCEYCDHATNVGKHWSCQAPKFFEIDPKFCNPP